MRKYLILALALCFLALFQQSFISHFKFFGTKLNLVLISIFFLNFFSKKESKFGIVAGFLGGSFLDLSGGYFLGTLSLTLTLVAIFIKKLTNYFQKSNILSAVLIFFLAFLVYKISFSFFQPALSYLFQKNFTLPLKFDFQSFFFEFSYNLIPILIFLIFNKKYGFQAQSRV